MDWMVQDLIPGRSRNLPLFQYIQTGPETHLAPYSMRPVLLSPETN
jgi:hypothetical protein